MDATPADLPPVSFGAGDGSGPGPDATLKDQAPWIRAVIFVAVHAIATIALDFLISQLWQMLAASGVPDASGPGPVLIAVVFSVGALIPTLLASLAAWLLPRRADLRVAGAPVSWGRFVALLVIGLAASVLVALLPSAGSLAWDDSAGALALLWALAQSWFATLIPAAGSAVAVFMVLWPLWLRRYGPWISGALAGLTVALSSVLLQLPWTDLQMIARVVAGTVLTAGVATLLHGSSPVRRMVLGALALSGASAALNLGMNGPSAPTQLLLLVPSLLVGLIAWLWGRTAQPHPTTPDQS